MLRRRFERALGSSASFAPGELLWLQGSNPGAGAPTETAKRLEVSLYWGDALLEVRTFAPGQSVRLGAAESEFPLEAAALATAFELVSIAGAIHPPPGAELRVPPGTRRRPFPR